MIQKTVGVQVLPMARCTETSDWPRVRAQRCRQCIDFTAFTDSSTSFTELNSMHFGDPEAGQQRHEGQRV